MGCGAGFAAGWGEAGRAGEGGERCALGAANRGVMFCNLLDRKGALIDCVVDILPAKQGGFLPGSGHPINWKPTGSAG